MDELQFGGTVVNGQGDHRDLLVPGRLELPNAPADWPVTLEPGSLNLKVSRYPDAWLERGLGTSVKLLDSGVFRPEFRTHLGLERAQDWPATVTLYGRWRV
jgi:hypothetical protein